MTNNPNTKQVGGNHYKQGALNHWDYATANGMSYLAGCATKYVCRWRYKAGRADLEKARHFVEKMLQLHLDGVLLAPEYGSIAVSPSVLAAEMALEEKEVHCLQLLTRWEDSYDLEGALNIIDSMISEDTHG